ncbi:hypothetical protein [Nocardia sp. NPDC127526]|uniref:hypothetical protein n=1 Tax=Nocardia sp. NPDC127526 TaxID=3345393 RepID=UPI003627FFE7
MSENPTPATEPDTEPGRRGQVSLILALVVVALVLIAGAVVVFGRDTGDEPTGGAQTSQTTAGVAPSANPEASGFATPGVDDFGRRVDIPNNPAGQVLPQTGTPHTPADGDWLTAAPDGTQGKGGWQRVYGAVVPFSTSDGPTRIVDGLATGWSHTPQGCALAAVYVLYQELARPDNRLLRERLMALTPAQMATYDKALAAGKLPAVAPENVTRWMIAFDAFKISSYADDLCTVRLATRARADKVGAAQWLSSEVAMVWDGTWRRRPPPGEGELPQEKVPSLTGWTPW